MNPLLIKGIVLAVLATAIFGAGWSTGSKLEENKWLRQQVEEEKAAAAARVETFGKDMAYELRIKDLEADARAKPTRVVRLCNQQVPAAGHTSEPAGTGEDGSTGVAGPDIGPGLKDFALAYRTCAERLNELQRRVNPVASSGG
jgi:hypothetical protein